MSAVREGDEPAPGGPHDPDAPSKLGPLSAADDSGADQPEPTADDAGLPPDGDDPMEGAAPTG